MDQFEKNLEIFSELNPSATVWIPYVGKKALQHSDTLVTQGLFKWLIKPETVTTFVYGIRDETVFKELSTWLAVNPKRNLVFLEDDLEVVHQVLDSLYGTQLLQHPQVKVLAFRFTDGKGPLQIAIDKDNALGQWSDASYEVGASYDYWNNRKGDFDRVFQALHYRMEGFVKLRILMTDHDRELASNTYLKFAQVNDSYDATSLIGAMKDVPAIICGAGPSLNEELPLLREIQDKCLIIGSGTALNILNKHGVYPAFGVGVDPNQMMQDNLFSNNTSFEAAIFYTSHFANDGFKHIHGPKLLFAHDTVRFPLNWFEEQLNIDHTRVLHLGNSTSCFALSLAQVLGCNPIIITGLDLAYSGGRKYADGVEIGAHTSNYVRKTVKSKKFFTFQMKNEAGKEFETTFTFLNESMHLSKIAALYPETKTYYTSKEGFGVKGVPYKPLAELVKSFKKIPQLEVLYPYIQSLPKFNVDVEKILKQWKDSLERCLKYTQRNTALDQIEIKGEAAYQNFLRLDEYYNIKIGNPHYRQQWIPLIQHHLEILDQAIKMPKPILGPVLKKGDDYFYENGQLKTHLEFKDGLLHATIQLFYPSGQLKREIQFQNGKREGADKTWDERGVLTAEAQFKDDKPVGTARKWHPNGQLAQELKYFDDQCDRFEWDENGVLIVKQLYSPSDIFKKSSKMADEIQQDIKRLLNNE